MNLVRLAAALALLPTIAFADQKAADTCAAKLPSNSATLYSASLPKVSSGANIADTLKGVARSMVFAGKLSRGDAKPAAEAAGNCLLLLKK